MCGSIARIASSASRVARTGEERLIVAPPHGEVGALRAGIPDGENVALVLILQIEVIMLDGRFLKIRIGNEWGSEKAAPGKRWTR